MLFTFQMLYETRKTLISTDLKIIHTNQHGWQDFRYWKERKAANGLLIHPENNK